MTNPKDILVIKLNRVDEDYKKINTPIDVQTNITFEQHSYKLKSFLCHLGEETESGHYTAYSFSDSGTVRGFDDLGQTGMPVFENVAHNQVQEKLKTAYILIYELQSPQPAQSSFEDSALLSPSPVPANLRTPLRTPISQDLSFQQDAMDQSVMKSPLTPFRTSQSQSQIQTKSPEAMKSPKERRMRDYQKDLSRQDSVEFYHGSVHDVKYVGRSDQSQFSFDLQDFFVIIPNHQIVMFRLQKPKAGEAPIRVLPHHITDFLLTNPEYKFKFQGSKLFFKDPTKVLDPEKDVSQYVSKDVAKPTFIFANFDYLEKHSGKLFSCVSDKCCDQDGFPDGWSAKTNFSGHCKRIKKGSCSLFMEDLFTTGKSGWGKNLECGKGKQKEKSFPYGCPVALQGEHVRKKRVLEEDPEFDADTEPTVSQEEITTDQYRNPGSRRAPNYQRRAAIRKRFEPILEEDIESDDTSAGM